MGPIDNLPEELVDEIFKYLPSARDRVRFGATCKRVWRIATPHVYGSITIDTSDFWSCFSVSRLPAVYSSLVKELTIVVPATRLPEPVGEWYDEPYDKWNYEESTLWKHWNRVMGTINTILGSADRDLLPKLETLNIQLPKDYAAHRFDWGYGQQTYPAQETMQRELEDLFRVIVRKGEKSITRLSICNLLPFIELDVWKTAPWSILMQQLERFELSVNGDIWLDLDEPTVLSHGAGVFRRFRQDIQENIFDHLHSVTHLKFESTRSMLFGQHTPNNENHDFPLPFTVGTMPRLMSLELGTTVVDRPLIGFLEGRARDSPPLSLRLTNAMCFDNTNHDQQLPNTCLTWTEAFDRMTSILDRPDHPGIKSFDATFIDITEIHYENMVEDVGFGPSNQDDLDELKELAGFETILPYVVLANETLDLECSEPLTRSAFLTGHDQAAYDRFKARLKQFSYELTLRR